MKNYQDVKELFLKNNATLVTKGCKKNISSLASYPKGSIDFHQFTSFRTEAK